MDAGLADSRAGDGADECRGPAGDDGAHAASNPAAATPANGPTKSLFTDDLLETILSETILLRMDHAQLSTTEHAVLGLVAFGERSGYDLARLAEQSVAYLWAPSRSQIYKILPRLVSQGLARTRRVRQPGRPDKALYKITPAGRRALRAWLEEVDDESSSDPNVFALKLFFCDLAPVRAAQAQLDGYGRFLNSRLRRFESMRRDLDEAENVFPQLILRRAIARIHATLLWVEEAKVAIDARQERIAGQPARTRAELPLKAPTPAGAPAERAPS